jgi:hypothetical protein
MKVKAQIGELPVPVVRHGFSFAAWNRKDKGKHPILSATAKGYRKQKARLLWSRIQSGKLTGPGAEAVRRDYAKEFVRLGFVPKPD